MSKPRLQLTAVNKNQAKILTLIIFMFLIISTAFAKTSIDGDADQVQLSIQGHSTQTSNLVTIEKSDGTDVFTVDNSGQVTSGGSAERVAGTTSAEFIDFNDGSDGEMTFGGAGATNNESFRFDFETTANTVGVETATGVTIFDFSLFDIKVSDEVYGGGWNASLETPTKNAVFDKIETITISGAVSHGARVFHSANVAYESGSDLAVAFNSERWDDDAMHDTVTNNSRITIGTGDDGRYAIGCSLRWATNTTGQRCASVKLNGTDFIASSCINSLTTGNRHLAVNTIYELAATYYVECFEFQNSGGSLNLDNDGKRSPEFWVEKINT